MHPDIASAMVRQHIGSLQHDAAVRRLASGQNDPHSEAQSMDLAPAGAKPAGTLPTREL